MAQRQQYPIFKIVATALGSTFGAVECWLNADTIAKVAGWVSPDVAIIVMASGGALAALPLAERAWKAGQPLKALGLGVLFTLMAAYSLTASLDRVAGQKDNAVATVAGDNNRTGLAKEGYETAKTAAATECANGRGKKCRDAEAALDAARKAYMAAPATRTEDSGTLRITAVLPFLPAEKVRLYQPLILPVSFQLGAFLFLALGLSPRAKPEPVQASEKAAPAARKRKPRKRKRTAVTETEQPNVFPIRAKAR
jgi:hypothetical protein